MRILTDKNFLLGMGCGLLLSSVLLFWHSPGTLKANQGGEIRRGDQQGTPSLAGVTAAGQSYALPEAPPPLPEAPLPLPEAPLPLPEAKPVQPSPEPSQPLTRETVTVEIPRGATSSQIGDLLVRKGLVRDTGEFLQAVNSRNLAGKFHAGTYTFTVGEEMLEIIAKLTKKEIKDLRQ